jgi:hypothetical protein
MITKWYGMALNKPMNIMKRAETKDLSVKKGI